MDKGFGGTTELYESHMSLFGCKKEKGVPYLMAFSLNICAE